MPEGLSFEEGKGGQCIVKLGNHLVPVLGCQDAVEELPGHLSVVEVFLVDVNDAMIVDSVVSQAAFYECLEIQYNPARCRSSGWPEIDKSLVIVPK